MLFGICGDAGSGKDTLAGMIKEISFEIGLGDFEKYNLADPLKGCVNDWLGWDETHSYGSEKERIQILPLKQIDESLIGYIVFHYPEHCTPEQAYEVCNRITSLLKRNIYRTTPQLSNVSSDPKDNAVVLVSPRQVYQWFGTEGMRECVSDSFWLDLIPEDSDVILADVRFDNEAQFVRDRGGILFQVERPDREDVAEHISEKGITLKAGDIVIKNTGSLEDLRNNIKDYLDSLVEEGFRKDHLSVESSSK